MGTSPHSADQRLSHPFCVAGDVAVRGYTWCFWRPYCFRPSVLGQGSHREGVGAYCAALVVLGAALMNFPW